MKQRSKENTKLIKGVVIVSVVAAAAAVIAFSAYKTGRDEKLSVESLKATVKDAVKDIKLPEPVSAADVNKILADNKRLIKKGRKISKRLYKDLEKEATKKINLVHDNFTK